MEISGEVGFAEDWVGIDEFLVIGVGHLISINIEVIKVNGMHRFFVFNNRAAHLEFACGDTDHTIGRVGIRWWRRKVEIDRFSVLPF